MFVLNKNIFMRARCGHIHHTRRALFIVFLCQCRLPSLFCHQDMNAKFVLSFCRESVSDLSGRNSNFGHGQSEFIFT